MNLAPIAKRILLENEIKIEDLSLPLWFMILIAFTFSILCTIWLSIYQIDTLQSQIDALPHKVCHNETIKSEFGWKNCSNYKQIEIPCPQNDAKIYTLAYCYKDLSENCVIEPSYYQKEVCEIK